MHACCLTWKQRVGAGQAAPVGGIPPAKSPQAAAALLHGHQGGVVNTRELLAAPRGETLAARTNSWEAQGKRQTKMKQEQQEEQEREQEGKTVFQWNLKSGKKLTFRASWSTPALAA